MSVLHLIGLVLAFLLLAAALPAARAEDGGEESEALPLGKVTLFTSGVGYFEHRATVQGEQKVTLTFDAEDVNDLLKSMVVQDLGGGRISAVTYGSRDPVSKALQSFAVDLTSNLTLVQLFEQLRGEKVYVETPEPLEGTILSVQTRTAREGDATVTRDYLNLLTEKGIRSIAFEGIRTVRLLDTRLDQEMRQALETLSLGRDNQKKTVTLSFSGEGERPVRVGYVQETPVWKTSYRLVLGEADAAYLQGWAIVENTTNRDWDDVVLTLVSGAPVSFRMNLYEPLYASRPEVRPELRPGVAPQRYERDLGLLSEELEQEAPSRKDARKMRSRRGGARGAPAEAAPPAPEAGGHISLDRGVESAAQGAEVGELFQYRIDTPVSLERQRSAMIPIVGESVTAEKVSVYDMSVHPQHPLNGLRLENTTALHLMQGPVTVFDGGAYAGDALLGDLPPGAKRLVTYAMDLEVEVSPESKSRPDELLSVRIAKGVLESSYRQRRTTTYVAKNDDASPKRVLIAHGFSSDWELLEPKEPEEKTRNQYRFVVDVDPKGRAQLRVVEERTYRQAVLVTNLRDDLIAYYRRAPTVSPAVREALAEVVRRKNALEDLRRQRARSAKEIEAIGKEQDRIRQNMGQIDRNSDLYLRYIEKFGAQETRIEELRQEIAATDASIAAAEESLEAYVRGLVIE